MTAKDLLFDKDGDLVIKNGDLKLTENKTVIQQQIKRALLTLKGEWFLNKDLGIPYYQEILGQKNSIDTIKDIFVAAIQRIDGVKELVTLNLHLDNLKRSLSINFTVIDSNHNIIEMEL